MSKRKVTSKTSLYSLPNIPDNLIKLLSDIKSDHFNPNNIATLPIIEYQKRRRERKAESQVKIGSSSLHLDDNVKNYPQLQLNTSKVDPKDLEKDFKDNRKSKSFKINCKHSAVSAQDIKKQSFTKQVNISRQTTPKYIQLELDADKEISHNIHKQIIILKRFISNTYEALDELVNKKQTISNSLQTSETIFVNNDQEILEKIKFSQRILREKLNEFSMKSAENNVHRTTEKQETYQKELIINKYFDTVLEKISRKVSYLNERNGEISKVKVVNMVKDEINTLAKTFENMVNFPVFLKNFSTENDKNLILPLIKDVNNQKCETKEILSDKLSPIMESQETNRSNISDIDEILYKKLKNVSEKEFYDKIRLKNRDKYHMNNDKISISNSNYNNCDSSTRINIKNSDNSTSIRDESKSIQENRIKGKNYSIEDIQDSQEIDLKLRNKENNKNRTVEHSNDSSLNYTEKYNDDQIEEKENRNEKNNNEYKYEKDFTKRKGYIEDNSDKYDSYKLNDQEVSYKLGNFEENSDKNDLIKIKIKRKIDTNNENQYKIKAKFTKDNLINQDQTNKKLNFESIQEIDDGFYISNNDFKRSNKKLQVIKNTDNFKSLDFEKMRIKQEEKIIIKEEEDNNNKLSNLLIKDNKKIEGETNLLIKDQHDSEERKKEEIIINKDKEVNQIKKHEEILINNKEVEVRIKERNDLIKDKDENLVEKDEDKKITNKNDVSMNENDEESNSIKENDETFEDKDEETKNENDRLTKNGEFIKRDKKHKDKINLEKGEDIISSKRLSRDSKGRESKRLSRDSKGRDSKRRKSSEEMEQLPSYKKRKSEYIREEEKKRKENEEKIKYEIKQEERRKLEKQLREIEERRNINEKMKRNIEKVEETNLNNKRKEEESSNKQQKKTKANSKKKTKTQEKSKDKGEKNKKSSQFKIDKNENKNEKKEKGNKSINNDNPKSLFKNKDYDTTTDLNDKHNDNHIKDLKENLENKIIVKNDASRNPVKGEKLHEENSKDKYTYNSKRSKGTSNYKSHSNRETHTQFPEIHEIHDTKEKTIIEKIDKKVLTGVWKLAKNQKNGISGFNTPEKKRPKASIDDIIIKLNKKLGEYLANNKGYLRKTCMNLSERSWKKRTFKNQRF